MTNSVVWCGLYLSTLSNHIVVAWWRSSIRKIHQDKVDRFADPLKNAEKSSKMASNSVLWKSWQVFHICLSSTHQYLSDGATYVYFWSIFMEWKSTADLSATDCSRWLLLHEHCCEVHECGIAGKVLTSTIRTCMIYLPSNAYHWVRGHKRRFLAVFRGVRKTISFALLYLLHK